MQGVFVLYMDDTKSHKSKSDREKVQILSDFFTSVYLSECINGDTPTLNNKYIKYDMTDLHITEETVRNTVKETRY